MNKVKVGIIGTGFTIGIAKQHVTAYQANERVELTAFYDIVPGRAAEWAQKHKIEGVAICESLEELFEKVDAVSVCTPNYTHIELTIKAIEAGKHVICEKPYAMSYEDGLKAVEFSKKHPGIVAGIGFNYREIPAVLYMKKLIDEGKIGTVYTVKQEVGGSRIADPTAVKLEWRMQEALSGAGALADFGCHMLDMADYLLADTQGKINEVTAMVSTFIKERDHVDEQGKGPVTNDDCAVFTAKMESGTLLSFTASRIGVEKQMMEIVGEGGMLRLVDKNKVDVWLKNPQGAYERSRKETVLVLEELQKEDGHKGLVNEFVAAILDGKPMARNLERGLYIQYILDMLKKSAEEGKTITL